jgi:hypothetical protein
MNPPEDEYARFYRRNITAWLQTDEFLMNGGHFGASTSLKAASVQSPLQSELRPRSTPVLRLGYIPAEGPETKIS